MTCQLLSYLSEYFVHVVPVYTLYGKKYWDTSRSFYNILFQILSTRCWDELEMKHEDFLSVPINTTVRFREVFRTTDVCKGRLLGYTQ